MTCYSKDPGERAVKYPPDGHTHRDYGSLQCLPDSAAALEEYAGKAGGSR